jgi:hypothetical protein
MTTCPTITARVTNDAGRGKKTSAKARGFIRRACSCAECGALRALARARLMDEMSRDGR